MTRSLLRTTVVGLLSAGMMLPVAAPALHAQVRPNNNNQQQPPKKPDPVVIKLQSAQRGRFQGQDVLVVTGVEVLSGKPRTFGVENERPQNTNEPAKFEPRAAIKEEIDKVKPGGYLKVEPKMGGGGGYGRYGNTGGTADWIGDAEPYVPVEHEEEPGTFVLFDSYKETEGGTEVYKITLMKFGQYFDCYAPMVKEGKSMVPDPAVVAAADAVKRKELVEASVSPRGQYLFVTSIDPYQAPRTGTFKKLVEADVNGNKGQAVEMEENGTAVTLTLPGKLVGKRWVTDSALLSAAKRLKPDAPVVFKTREAEGQTFVRSLAAAPKEKDPKKAGSTAAGGDSDKPKFNSK